MGVFGISLLFVGFILVINSLGAWKKINSNSLGLINLIIGVLLIIINLIGYAKSDLGILASNSAAAGLMYALSYVIIGLVHFGKLDAKIFGWFCALVLVFSILTIGTMIASRDFNTLFLILWILWSVFWLEGFLELGLGVKALGKVYPYLALIEGVAFILLPSLSILFDFGWL